MNKLQQLKDMRNEISLGGGQAGIEKQHADGKLTARERIELLFDEGTFVELDAFAKHRCTAFDMAEKKAPGEGVVTGYGQVNGRLVYAFSQDATVMGGSIGEVHAAKIVKVQQMAMEMGAPIVGMHDSAGARIQEGVAALSGVAKIMYNNTMASGVVPQISVIMGPCAGGAAYAPAITDYILMVENTSQLFVNGPKVVQAETGVNTTLEQLGGAMTNNEVSGNAHDICTNDEEAIEKVRELLGYMPSNNLETAPDIRVNDDPNRLIPELNELIPDDLEVGYNMYEVIRSIADGGKFFEIMPHFGKSLITGYIRINGQVLGVVANQPWVENGQIGIDAADKAARFIRRCDAFNIPLLTLEDTPGFITGTEEEFGGMVRHGAKLFYAYAEATVPKVTVILRKAYGGAYVAMGSKELGGDVVMAWPSAQIAVLGSNAAANIVFKNEIGASENPIEKRKEMVAKYEEEFSNPYRAAEMGFVDDVIEPATTRQYLAATFDMLRSKRKNLPAKKHGNIPL